MSFQSRAKQVMRKGDLTVGDLRIWFDRPYTTVWRWVESGWEPGLFTGRKTRNSSGQKAEADLALLEKALQLKLLPLPTHMASGGQLRPRYLKQVYHAAQRARLPQADPAGRGT